MAESMDNALTGPDGMFGYAGTDAGTVTWEVMANKMAAAGCMPGIIPALANIPASTAGIIPIGATQASSLTLTVSATIIREVLTPCFYPLHSGITLDQMYVEVTTGQATALGVIAIYENKDNSSFYPGARIARSTSLDFSTGAMRTSTVTAFNLKVGRLYWAGAASSVTGVVVTASLPPNPSTLSTVLDTRKVYYRDVETDIANTFANPFPTVTLAVANTGSSVLIPVGKA